MKALFRVSDGKIIIPELAKPLTGTREVANLENGIWCIIEYGPELYASMIAEHCYVALDKIELLPESEWPENQPGYYDEGVE